MTTEKKKKSGASRTSTLPLKTWGSLHPCETCKHDVDVISNTAECNNSKSRWLRSCDWCLGLTKSRLDRFWAIKAPGQLSDGFWKMYLSFRRRVISQRFKLWIWYSRHPARLIMNAFHSFSSSQRYQKRSFTNCFFFFFFTFGRKKIKIKKIRNKRAGNNLLSGAGRNTHFHADLKKKK